MLNTPSLVVMVVAVKIHRNCNTDEMHDLILILTYPSLSLSLSLSLLLSFSIQRGIDHLTRIAIYHEFYSSQPPP